MRKRIFTLLSVCVILGCTSQPSVEQSEPVQQKEEPKAAAEKERPKEKQKEQPKEKVEKIITDTLSLLVREESSKDGFIDRYIEISYEEDGVRRTEEKEYGIDGTLEKTVVFEYAAGDNPVKVSTFDGSGGLVSYHEYELDEEGMVVSDSVYTSKKELQVQSLYEYDSRNRKVKWTVRNGAEIVQAYTEYLYGNYPVPEKIEMYTSSGTLESYVENEFDSQGHHVRETYREVDGSVSRYIEYEYSGGFLVEERHYRGNQALIRTVSYEYDSDGNGAVVVYSGPGGEIQERKTRFYISRSVERVVIE